MRHVVLVLVYPGNNTASMDGERLLTADLVLARLQEIAPSASWLRNTSVERLLNLPYGNLSAFLTSIQPEKRGSTRHQTRVSETQRQLERAGIFFKNGYVAVGNPGDAQPDWGGVKYSHISEPVLRPRFQLIQDTASDEEVRAELPGSASLVDPPVTGIGLSPADPHDDNGSDRRESGGEGISAGNADNSDVSEERLSCDGSGSDTVDTADVRDVGRPAQMDDRPTELAPAGISNEPVDTAPEAWRYGWPIVRMFVLYIAS